MLLARGKRSAARLAVAAEHLDPHVPELIATAAAAVAWFTRPVAGAEQRLDNPRVNRVDLAVAVYVAVAQILLIGAAEPGLAQT